MRKADSTMAGRNLRAVPCASALAPHREYTLSDVKVEKHEDGDHSWSPHEKFLSKKIN